MKRESYISRFIFTFVVSALLWMGFTFPPSNEEIIIGIIVAFVVSLWGAKYIVELGLYCFSPVKLINAILYIPFLLWEIIKANIQVAIIVLSPRLPIKPAIVQAKTELKSDVGKMTLANSITLTPGTLTIDIIDDTYFIHCVKIDDTSEEYATETIIKKFERRIRRFLG